MLTQTVLNTDVCHSMVEQLFQPGEGFGIAAELEFFTARPDGSRPAVEELRGMLAPLLDEQARLAGGGAITIEPGGQVELASAPWPSISQVMDSIRVDSAAIFSELRRSNLDCWIGAIDTRRPPERVETHPRYALMEARFDAFSPAGRWMMNNTCSLQININNFACCPRLQWELFWRVGPILTAIFANSPGRDQSGQMWQSLRQGCWLALDPQRTGPIDVSASVDGYLKFALDAPLLVIRDETGEQFSPPPPGLTIRQWLQSPAAVGREPTMADFKYHLSTLFPDVRPRGWMELRPIDMGELRHCEAALSLVAAISMPEPAAELLPTIEPVSSRVGSQIGLGDSRVAAAAERIFDVANRSLADVPGADSNVLQEFYQTYTERGISPGKHGFPHSQDYFPDLSRAPE